MVKRAAILMGLALSVWPGCGEAERSSPSGQQGSSTSTSSSSGIGGNGGSAHTGGSANAGGEPGSGGGAPEGCADEASRIYFATGGDRLLFSYDPIGDKLELHGAMDCTPDKTAYAITVDREGIVWVYFHQDHIYKVDPATLACTQTDWVDPSDVTLLLSMSFATDPTDPSRDRLYANLLKGSFSDGPAELAEIDLTTMEPTTIGPVGADLVKVALNSNGSTTLFGLHVASSGNDSLLTLNTANGEVISEHAVTALNAMSWPTGFGFWGGDVWFAGHYLNTFGLFRYSIANDSVTTIIDNIWQAVGKEGGGLVTGVGTSVCTPLQPPK